MTQVSFLRCAVVWGDIDLLELEVAVQCAGWAGHERAYVTREELATFADELEAVWGGGTAAQLDGGQEDLTFTQLRVLEYGRARSLALEVRLGRAPGTMEGVRDGPTLLQVRVPIERGTLADFARSLRRIGSDKRGSAELPLPVEWA